MILLDLLAVLVVGLSTFAISRLFEFFRPKRRRRVRRRRYAQPKPLTRSQIETELDRLLMMYNQGILTEEQYSNQANHLIDQLSEVLNGNPVLTTH